MFDTKRDSRRYRKIGKKIENRPRQRESNTDLSGLTGYPVERWFTDLKEVATASRKTERIGKTKKTREGAKEGGEY